MTTRRVISVIAYTNEQVAELRSLLEGRFFGFQVTELEPGDGLARMSDVITIVKEMTKGTK